MTTPTPTPPADPRLPGADPVPSTAAGRPHAFVPVDREGHPRRCTAMSKRSGKRCRSWAVEGMSVCRMHGGSSPQARAAAERRRVEAEATVMLESIWDPSAASIRDPVEALAALAGKTEHAVDVLGAHVTAGGLDGPAMIAWSRTLRELRQMLEGLERLGLEDRRVRVNEQVGTLLASCVRRILDRLELSPEQWAAAVVVAPEELRRLNSGAVVEGEVER